MSKRNIWGWPRGPPHYENGGLLPMDFMVYLFIRKERLTIKSQPPKMSGGEKTDGSKRV